MINKLSHASIYVLDQDSAYDYYVNKLGFEVRTDFTMEGGFRWLTVGPKTQPDLDIVLMPVGNDENSAALADLIRKGTFGIGVFETLDCKKSYEELTAKRG